MKKALKTNDSGIERDLEKLEKSAKKFQKVFDVLVKYNYQPSLPEFQKIIYGRTSKKDNPLDDFLKERTVKMHPAIDNLPITPFMKKTMIQLPKECDEIIQAYEGLPANLTFLSDVFKMDIIKGKVCLSDLSKQDVIDSHSIYANEKQYSVFKRATNLLNELKTLHTETGINIFENGVVLGTIADCEVNPYAIVKNIKP